MGSWAAALFYVNDAFSLYWLSDPESRHLQDIADHPNVAVTINEDYRDWRLIRAIQMEGTTEQVGTVRDSERAMRLYAAKFTFLRDWRNPPIALAASIASARVYRFSSSRVLFVDNTKAFGHREEVWSAAR